MEARNTSLDDMSYRDEVFPDDEEWLESDEENQAPQTGQKPKRSKLTKPSNLHTLAEEPSQISSSYLQQSSRAQSSAPSRRSPSPVRSPVTRKPSVSFSDDEKSFGKIDDVEQAFKEAAADCKETNRFRPAPDVTHDSQKLRSWEPTVESLNISRNSTNVAAARTPVTSTPKSDVSAIRRFDTQISAITSQSQISMQNVSNAPKFNNNETSTLSGSRINQMIKDIAHDQSSVEMAKQFIGGSGNPDYKTRVQKKSYFLDRTKDASRIAPRQLQNLKGIDLSSTSTSRAAQLKPKSLLPKPALPLLIEHSTISSRLSSAVDGAEIAIKPEPFSHWGFVTIGDEVQAKVYVRNQTENIIEIFPSVRDDSNSFKLVSNENVHLQPHTTHEFGIIFCPKTRKRICKEIIFMIGGSGNRYSHRLFGFGGAADIKVMKCPFISYYPRDGVYRAKPADPYSFAFELENVGERSAFVRIVPEGAKNVSVSPQSFCLYGKEIDSSDTKTKITVKFPEGYVEDAARMSLGSATSASTFSRNTVFSLKVYYGVERLRQRAAKYSDHIGRHETFKGLNLTKTPFLLKGNPLDGRDKDPVSQQDVEMLKAQTHVLTIIVGDERMTYSLPCRPVSSQSREELNFLKYRCETSRVITRRFGSMDLVKWTENLNAVPVLDQAFVAPSVEPVEDDLIGGLDNDFVTDEEQQNNAPLEETNSEAQANAGSKPKPRDTDNEVEEAEAAEARKKNAQPNQGKQQEQPVLDEDTKKNIAAIDAIIEGLKREAFLISKIKECDRKLEQKDQEIENVQKEMFKMMEKLTSARKE